jgi:arginine decarboxylase
VRIYLTLGVGEGPTELAAFDKALWDAGIPNFNLIYLSSVIPPGAELVREVPPEPSGTNWGDRLYVVIAQQREVEIRSEAWAGIGWVQDQTNGRGLFVEHHGNSCGQVEGQIHESLRSMLDYRKGDWSDIDLTTVGVTCANNPVCAVAAAVYAAEGWS